MDDIIEQLKVFCDRALVPFLNTSGGKLTNPQNVFPLLAKYWLLLAILALYVTQLRANQYFIELGKNNQKKAFLLSMAQSNFIAALALHEKAIRNPLNFETKIEKYDNIYYLSGMEDINEK